MRNLLTVPGRVPRRTGSAALAVAFLLTLCGPLLPVTATDEFGPQVSVDRNVAERGAIVTIALNGFPAGQALVLTVSPEGYPDQSSAIATLPVNVDARGGASVTVSTAGLATGNYIVTIAAAGVSAPLLGVGTAFGVIDPGTLGPRVVIVYPTPRSDKEEG